MTNPYCRNLLETEVMKSIKMLLKYDIRSFIGGLLESP